MNRILISLILLSLACGNVFAQTDSLKVSTTPMGSIVTTTAKVSKDRPTYIFPKNLVGVSFGHNLSHFHFRDAHDVDQYDVYTHNPRIYFMAGIFGQFQLGNSPFSVRPELVYTSKGDSLNWCDVRYSITTKYIDFRMPITFNFRIDHSRFSPYLMVVPQAGMAFDGKAYYRDDIDYPQGISVPVTKASAHDIDASVMFGVGVDYLVKAQGFPIVFSLEAGYNMGLLNSFSERERYGNPNVGDGEWSNIANIDAADVLWQGARRYRGVEYLMRLGIPIDNSWKKKEEKTIVQQIVERTDTVYVKVEVPVHDTVRDTLRLKMVKAAAPSDNYVYKDCYSIPEFMAYLVLGQDVSDKRICLFNIHFDFDKFKLRDVSKPSLQDVARMMHEFPEMKVKIMGHTDIRGTDEYNDKLSLNRAKAVIDYLVSLGIDRERFIAEGYGKRHTIDSGETEDAHERNRRVEIEVLNVGMHLTDDTIRE